jgi:hypothetical protein
MVKEENLSEQDIIVNHAKEVIILLDVWLVGIGKYELVYFT